MLPSASISNMQLGQNWLTYMIGIMYICCISPLHVLSCATVPVHQAWYLCAPVAGNQLDSFTTAENGIVQMHRCWSLVPLLDCCTSQIWPDESNVIIKYTTVTASSCTQALFWMSRLNEEILTCITDADWKSLKCCTVWSEVLTARVQDMTI